MTKPQLLQTISPRVLSTESFVPWHSGHDFLVTILSVLTHRGYDKLYNTMLNRVYKCCELLRSEGSTAVFFDASFCY